MDNSISRFENRGTSMLTEDKQTAIWQVDVDILSRYSQLHTPC